ncbi:AraC family transcriptional regulator [uncultured Enterococcus sp.]|uniref:helix-turn-helix domain-containing protein n=1 Tax=uncultured Enterococcus sp. TaxID=167972 RepID=UPI002AA8A54F|nr:AraC family transcriptional regulator [uncultured Enterococcus sp.]
MQNFVRQFHYINEQHFPLIRGIGIGQGSTHYDWDARQRKEQLIVLQVTLSGQGYIQIGEKTIPLTQNKAFFAKIPGNYRYFGENWHFLFIEFSGSMTQWLDTSVAIVELSEGFIERLRGFILDLKTQEVTVTQNAKAAFTLFVDIKEEVQKESQQKTAIIEAIKKYIDEHYFEDISLEFLSDKYDLSKYKLIRQFEAAYNSPPIHYLKKVRILHSLSLLWEEETVEIVARKVGFSTGNYFSKVFKKEMSISPSEYKNRKTHYY